VLLTNISTQRYSFYSFTALVVALALLRVAISIAAIIFSFIKFYRSTKLDISALPAHGRAYPSEGPFTLEAFSCQIRDYANDSNRKGLNQWFMEGVSD
jgi:hypothetical protein